MRKKTVFACRQIFSKFFHFFSPRRTHSLTITLPTLPPFVGILYLVNTGYFYYNRTCVYERKTSDRLERIYHTCGLQITGKIMRLLTVLQEKSWSGGEIILLSARIPRSSGIHQEKRRDGIR